VYIAAVKTNNVSLRFSPSAQTLLRLEGLLEFAAAIALYAHLGGNGWIFGALLLTPDIAMLGYLRSPQIGAFCYNLAHTTTQPLAIAVIAFLMGATTALLLALIWIAHIGMDRSVGYGFKSPDSFKSTHLSR
jgi:RsiW-degrading membrane proteinase PrsW (M82 family)